MAHRESPFEQMNRMMEQMRRAMLEMGPRNADLTLDAGEAERYDLTPAFGEDSFGERSNLTLERDDEGFVVLADVPGFEREELDLRFEDGVLRIEGVHEMSDDRSARRRHIHERMRVPGEVREAEITATYRNGVLEIHLPTEDHDAEAGHSIDIEE